jgi:hypothetical protein
MDRLYALKMPRNSIRAIVMLILTIGFVMIHVVVLLARLNAIEIEPAIFADVYASYNGIFGVVVAFYFKSRESEDRNETNYVQANNREISRVITPETPLNTGAGS